MRFGAFVPQGWRLDLVGIDVDEHWPTMVDVAQAIERSGFESLWLYDHLHTFPVPTQEVTYEAWTLMAALSTVTSTVRLGQMCTCNSYRPPSYLAKVAASIDVISGGRVEMGIGAGWYQGEYEGYGYDFPKPSVRIGMLAEAVEIMQRMWTEDEVHFDGTHYTLRGAICRPKPVQQPHIPLWIAGGGEKLTLAVAAEFADYTNFGGNLETFIHKSEVLAGHCREIGRDFDSITRSANFNVLCAPSEEELDAKMDRMKDRYRPFLGDERVEKFGDRWGTVGTPEQLIEHFRAWEAAGLEYAIGYFGDLPGDTSGLELFAAEVMPALVG